MKRRQFIDTLLTATGSMITLGAFADALGTQKSNDLVMPAMFVGHGSPMNAIEMNAFSKTWQVEARKLPHPKAILCISAHWYTKGTYVAISPKPETIHDFGGFPKALFDVQYPAPGAPDWAHFTKDLITSTTVQEDSEWGLDHGTWSILAQMYPMADIPVYQLSIDYTKPPAYHYQIGQELRALRQKGVLIIGSGNIVHNLGMINFSQPDAAYDWALEFDEKIKQYIVEGNHQGIINYESLGKAAKLSVPSNDHYLPLLYTLGLQQKNESIAFFNEKSMMGSISMRSLKIYA
jgi:4,5-DOPA dioxygenase extradiol